jgi:purine-nucleoside phosphorylase
MTDDPMRAKMMAAHWLEYAEILYDLRGMIGYVGSYNDTPLALLSAGFGETSTLLYLHDALLLGMRRVIYIGECISHTPAIRLRDVIIAQGGHSVLTQCAIDAAQQCTISISEHPVNTYDRALLETTEVSGNITDFASGAVADFAATHGIAALSILTVSQNTSTEERMEDHERQSRFNDASRLVFETLAMDDKKETTR